MPRKVTAYGCEFKCGHGVIMSKARMKEHEERCYYNPKNRACITCGNFSSELSSNGMEHEPRYLETWREMECDGVGKALEKMTSNCNVWTSKSADQN